MLFEDHCGTEGCGICEKNGLTLPAPSSDTWPKRPNRFDPFEALDELVELSPLAGVRRNVERLRAYITGMEKQS